MSISSKKAYRKIAGPASRADASSVMMMRRIGI
jgi:hypothetical protein